MLFIIIAVFAVLIIMNTFMVIVLRHMADNTGRQIEKDAAHLYAVYDRVLEEKSQKVKVLEEAMEALGNRERSGNKMESPLSGAQAETGCILAGGSYQDEDFVKLYHRIGETFRFDVREILSFVKGLCAGQTEEARLLQDIAQHFSFYNLYEISTLPPEGQKQILTEVLTPQENLIFEEYCECTEFKGVSEFLLWVEERRKACSGQIVIRTGESGLYRQLTSEANTGFLVEQEPGICDGFIIMQGNRLYDFSI